MLTIELNQIELNWILIFITRKFGASQTSISKSLRGATTGQDEFSLATLMSSEYDLKLAVAKFRFAICPKVIILCDNTII